MPLQATRAAAGTHVSRSLCPKATPAVQFRSIYAVSAVAEARYRHSPQRPPEIISVPIAA